MILPVSNPIVGSYQSLCCPYVILQNRDKDALLWLLLNSMIHSVYFDREAFLLKSNLAGDNTPWGLKLLYDECPFFNTYKMNRTFLRDNNIDIIAYIKWCVLNETYLHMDVNVAKISAYGVTSKYKCRTHNIFIYGIDNISVFFGDFIKEAGFKYYSCSHDEIRDAYDSYEYNCNWVTGYESLIGIKYQLPIHNREEYPMPAYLNSERLRYEIDEHIKELRGDTRGKYMMMDNNHSYGLATYSMIINYLETLNENRQSDYRWCLRTTVSFLKDHKTVMYKLFLDFDNNRTLALGYKKLLDNANIALMLTIKFLLKNDDDIIKRLISLLKTMESVETSILLQY